MSGQTISDRLLAARHSLAGQGLAKSVCKATTEEVIGPKKKHLDYLIHCTNEPNVSIPQLANLLIERSQNSNWVVVYKALVTTHHLMCYGNERFTQFLASNNCSFQLGNFLDKSNVAGYDMSPFIRRYAKYLNEKALSYRTVAFDFCKVKRGKEDGVLRVMAAEKLLKTLPVIQNQLDALLEFDCAPNDLNNGVINTAFLLLFRDLIRLFACYNDGIINLLEKYFDMNKKQCKDALDFYKKFLVRMDRVAEFLKVAETVGIDKGDIPDLTKAPSSLLEALEAHLAGLEGRKPNSSSNLNATQQQNGGGGAGAAAPSESIDDSLKRQVLADEEAALSQFKKNTNPFLSSPTTAAAAPAGGQQVLDLFGNATETGASHPPKASDDLLELAANPFASPAAPPVPPLPVSSSNTWASSAAVQNGFAAYFANENSFAAAFGNAADKGTNAADDPGMHAHLFGAGHAHPNPPPRPPPPSSGSPAPAAPYPMEDLLGGFDSLGPTLSSTSSPAHCGRTEATPTPPLRAPSSAKEEMDASFSSPSKQAAKGFDAFGDLLQPTASASLGAAAPKAAGATVPAPAAPLGASKVLTGDLDSSLASLAQNLNISKPQSNKAPQWNVAANKPAAAPVQGMAVMQPVSMAQAGGASAGWPGQPMMGATHMQAAPMGAYRPMMGNVPPMGPSMTPMAGMTSAYGSAQPMNPMMATGMRPGGAPMMSMAGAAPYTMGMPQTMGAMGMPTMPMRPAGQQAPQQHQQLDPFGAL